MKEIDPNSVIAITQDIEPNIGSVPTIFQCAMLAYVSVVLVALFVWMICKARKIWAKVLLAIVGIILCGVAILFTYMAFELRFCGVVS